VLRNLDGKISLVVDAGQAQVGIESTVVDLTGSRPRTLRPGMITERQILEALGFDATINLPEQPSGAPSALRSPGMLAKHYAPQAKILVWTWNSEAELGRKLLGLNLPPGHVHLVCHEQVPQNLSLGRISVIPFDAEAYARALYAEWHTSDELGAKVIIVEALPDSADWEGIRDRLKRASAE
jgi:L-threonylcarbamoyladenylate synthase